MENDGKTSGNDEILNFLSREKFYSDHILDNSRSMLSIINRNYIYEKVNATFCEAQSVFASSIVGKSLGDVWGKVTFLEKIKGNIDRCFSGEIVRYEACFTIPKSGKRYFDVIFRPFPVESGEITHLLAETFDITGLKLSEKNAIEKEEEFKRFETNLPIGFVRCSPDGRILHANRAFLMIMDCNDENLLCSSNLRDYYADKGLFEMQLEQFTDSKSKVFGRVMFKTCKSSEIVCRITAYMCLDQSGNPTYIDFAFEDSSRELMLENRLLQAQKLETIGALAGGIAHDFNNILTTISGYSELLQDDLPPSSPSSDKVSKIMMAVSKARSLTNQILTFSRQVEQEKVNVNVYDVLKETIGFIRSAVPSGIKIRSLFRIQNAPVLADPTQLFRVFLNLLTNAVQSMEEQGGIISVSLSVVKGEKVHYELNENILADEYVLVTFKDSGKGMDPSLLRRIFEPFFTTREVGKGSGLGLSVVHGIISEMGGEILVSSKKNIGSAFHIYLPVSTEFTKPGKVPEKKKRILFITGNKHESRILSLALENSGYELIESSGRKHLMMIMADLKSRPDLIVYMSDAKLIRTNDLLNIFNDPQIKTPCILVTDANYDSMEEKLVNSGIIKQHLIKPVSLKEIKNAIQGSIN